MAGRISSWWTAAGKSAEYSMAADPAVTAPAQGGGTRKRPPTSPELRNGPADARQGLRRRLACSAPVPTRASSPRPHPRGTITPRTSPTSPHGRIVATTRRRDAALTGEGRRLIEVGLFTEADAVTYLAASLAAHGRREHGDHLTALARDLALLPLALAQASAYLIDSGESVPTYRALLADRATELADAVPGRLPDEQTVALAAAWSLSIARADQLRPIGPARPMLQLAAVLDPNGIPHSILTSEPALTYLTAYRTPAGQDSTEEPGQVSPEDAGARPAGPAQAQPYRPHPWRPQSDRTRPPTRTTCHSRHPRLWPTSPTRPHRRRRRAHRMARHRTRL